jgi:N utilization substance protein A
VSELRGEKIDIIPWNTEPARFVAKALSPARVREVYIDDDSKEATVVVPDDQLALAIGKEGLNARLAARLTGWRVDIQSDSEFARAESEAAFGGSGEEGDFTGRCAAVLTNGKRCPNASLPGSRFCGVPAHTELAKIEAETGEYAPGTVTPGQPDAEDDDAALQPADAPLEVAAEVPEQHPVEALVAEPAAQGERSPAATPVVDHEHETFATPQEAGAAAVAHGHPVDASQIEHQDPPGGVPVEVVERGDGEDA